MRNEESRAGLFYFALKKREIMNEQSEIRIELKYCERCGGLFFRGEGSPRVYCVTCAPEMAQVARGAKKQPVSVKWHRIHGGVECA